MKTFFTKSICLLVLACLFGSCASSYKSLKPETLDYTAKTESNQILLEYKYDVLLERGNNKYAKRERRNFIQVAAVKITNNSDKTITIGETGSFRAGNTDFIPVAPAAAHSKLKQGVPIYLLYLLATPVHLNFEKRKNGMVTESGSFPIGVILGPGLTFANLITASSANQWFLKELSRYDLQHKQVRPGDTVYGLVAIPNGSYNPLYLMTGPDEQVQR